MNARILVVEDNSSLRLVIAILLEQAGYHVTQAPNGEIALTLLETEDFDVVLTDIIMGNVDGIEVLHTAKRQTYNPEVILLTGYGELETSIAAIRLGAYNYLLKPCDDQELLSCIHKAVEYHKEQALIQEYLETSQTCEDIVDDSPTIRRIGIISIGSSREDVTCNDQPLSLTPIEYALLCLLSQMPGKLYSYSDILKHTHQIHMNDVDANGFLRNHVRNLRRKIPSSYLVHESGKGYKLIIPDEPSQHPTHGDGDDQGNERNGMPS